MNQDTLFDLEKKKRTRVQDGYKKSVSKDGSLSVHFAGDLANRVREHCRITNQNCRKFVTALVEKGMDQAETEMFEQMSRDDLINMIKRLKDGDKAEKEGKKSND